VRYPFLSIHDSVRDTLQEITAPLPLSDDDINLADKPGLPVSAAPLQGTNRLHGLAYLVVIERRHKRENSSESSEKLCKNDGVSRIFHACYEISYEIDSISL
jgi:hypothetical protein